MNTNTLIDLNKLYKTYFNNAPYYITNDQSKPLTQDVNSYHISQKNPHPKGAIQISKHHQPFNKIGSYGQNIWHPITLKIFGGVSIEIEACTLAVYLSKTIVKTPVIERQGTVKECLHSDDYRFVIKGFLIDKNRLFPEEQINTLKEIFESTVPVFLFGGYPEMFLGGFSKIAIETLEFPEVQGKAPWIKPFQMTCESDFIKDLTIDNIAEL